MRGEVLVSLLAAAVGGCGGLPANPCGELIRAGDRCVCPDRSVPLDDWSCQLEDGTVITDPNAPDGSRRDAGGPETSSDVGPVDATTECSVVTLFVDDDGDGFGDSTRSVSACAPLDGHVLAGGDCDDTNPAIHPGARETCDGVDQDCDGAIDEGLIRALGEPIEVARGPRPTELASAVALRSGFAVVWRDEAEDVTRASFFARSGTSIEANVFVTGHDAGSFRAARYDRGGVDQVVIMWVVRRGLWSTMCSSEGVCTVARGVAEVDPSASIEAMVQLRGSIVIRLREASGARLLSIDPGRGGGVRGEVRLPAVEGQLRALGGLATVAGHEPYVLVSRVEGRLEGGSVHEVTAALMRVRGEELSFNEEHDLSPWDVRERCVGDGVTHCFPAVLPLGQADIDQPSLVIYEAMLRFRTDGSSSASHCLFGPTPRLDSAPTLETGCIEGATRMAVAPRGSVALQVSDFEAEWGARDIPLGGTATGGDYASVGAFESIESVSMLGAHGVVVGPMGSTLSAVRLGCTPP
ncbi:MAG: putative metal-binding motif-containing protein [Myxococcales bacterium]|nr:putative metal-binding motif-containing protein [Myxococcales bacterium]